MPYLLIDDGMAENPKVVGLSDKAFRLWITCLVYSARNLTDGAISEIALRSLAPISGIAKPLVVAKQLVESGLFEATGGGWQIHDYLEYNPSRAEMDRKRAKARERKRRFDQSRNGVTNGARNAGVTLSKTPPRGSLKRPPLLMTEAEQIAKAWTAPDSDAFAEQLDELERTHGGRIGAVDRERLWDIALTTIGTAA